MGEEPAKAEPERYRAFISYSHGDSKFAHWLHRKLESWRLPDKSPLTPVFIDRAELAAGSDLSAQVREALEQSAALVVVCSPNARTSRWVGQEIELFRALHPDRPVLAALIEGEPDEAFPAPLLGTGEAPLEPLAADFRKGHDGQRLGLLKLAAGLTALPLDQLVQREAQARQRRVMAVTAGALALVLVLSAALVIALRARAEAERQRAEAEGLVEFMLTDLRDKLRGVGRLDVMDAVNQRAMAYYEDQPNLAALNPDSLERRARVIGAMGELDEVQGRKDAAYEKYLEVARTAEALLAKDPDNPARIIASARSENRLALAETSKGNTKAAAPRFMRAKSLLDRLPASGAKPEWIELRSMVVGNLCAITLKNGGIPATAMSHCQEAVGLAKQRSALPGQENALYDLVFHYLWLGDAAQAAGRATEAAQAHKLGLETSNRLIARDPKNWFWLEQNCEVNLSLAKRAMDAKNLDLSNFYTKSARTNCKKLIDHDKNNPFWMDLYRKSVQ